MPGEALREFQLQQTMTLELDKVGHELVIVSAGANGATIQATVVEGSWGSGVLTVERSNDGETWVALASATTISADGITSVTPDTSFMRVRVSTAGSAGDKVKVAFYVRLS